MAGIPSMVVTRAGFSQIVGNAFAGFGFPAEGPTVYEFPNEMFDAGSDLTPLQENADKIVYGLTKWEPKIKAEGIYKADQKVTVQGTNYEEALANLNALFLKNLWGDGLTVLPATEERVNWILTGTDLPRDQVIGTILPRGGIATVEDAAIALAMVGGRPEYMPVLLAGIEAIVDPAMVHEGWQATTNSNAPALIVSGPIAKQIRLSSGYGCLGPDPQHPAGSVIGRAIRLMLQDLGGATPGIGTMAIYGGAYRHGIVIAEDEAGLLEGWPSLAEERGFQKGANVVTASVVHSQQNVLWDFGSEDLNERVITKVAAVMAGPNQNRTWHPDKDVSNGILLLPRGFVASLADVNGYSKASLKQALWERSVTPWSKQVEWGHSDFLVRIMGGPEGEDLPITPRPEQIMIVVAGGEQSGHGYWMQGGFAGSQNVSKEIHLPAQGTWDALIAQAEADLGPMPAW